MCTTIFTLYWHASDKTYPIPLDEYWTDEVADGDGQQQLAECELHHMEIQHKAKALLAYPGAAVLASDIAEDLVRVVQMYPGATGDASLTNLLSEQVAEYVTLKAMEGRGALLEQPVNRDGFIEIRKTLDAACSAFEALLSAETAG